jgi:RNA polymerase sigma-70 factor (ECF subfamily)
VKAFLARTGCETHSIDDLVQETFLRAWSGRNQFSGRVQPRTWLFGIARNTARESWRRRMITQPLDAEASLVEYDHAFIDTEMKQSLRSAVRQLPPKQRIAISLVYFDGFTQIDAAARTACAHDAFRRRLASGRSRLRTLLNADHTA